MNEPGTGISEADAAALARWAGLTVPPEQLPRLAVDLAAARAAVADLALAGIDSTIPVNAPFDPAWPDEDDAQ